jgi:hypothetical protein
MSVRTCEQCGTSFEQFGRGRPAKRCHECRSADRYGAVHQQLREQAPSAYGLPCTRCGLTMLPEHGPIEPDHRDGGGPHDYAGYAHASCNHRAGASNGNRMRAAAYRAMRGLPAPAAVQKTAAAENSPPDAAPVEVKVLPPRLDPFHQCAPSGCHDGGVGSPCRCGRHSRVW